MFGWHAAKSQCWIGADNIARIVEATCYSVGPAVHDQATDLHTTERCELTVLE